MLYDEAPHVCTIAQYAMLEASAKVIALGSHTNDTHLISERILVLLRSLDGF